MSGATRQGQDTTGGTNIEGSPNVFTNGSPQVRVGDSVASHGKCPHCSPVMSSGSGSVFVNGIPACRSGDSATCGHTASGSGDVFIG